MSGKKAEKTLEENFKRLDELTEKMEDGDTTLEKMYSLYKEGIELIKECNKKIDTVEKNIKLIDSNGEYSDFE